MDPPAGLPTLQAGLQSGQAGLQSGQASLQSGQAGIGKAKQSNTVDPDDYAEICKSFAIKDHDKYDLILFDFGNGKYKSALDIPENLRNNFVMKLKEQDELPF